MGLSGVVIDTSSLITSAVTVPSPSVHKHRNLSAPPSGGVDRESAVVPPSSSTLPVRAIWELHQVAVEANLAAARAELLGGIAASVVASFPAAASPAGQLLSDLHCLNHVGRLADGSSPLAMWITNAVALTRGRSEEAVFHRFLGEASRWATVPTYPDVETRYLSEQIEAARTRERALASAGEDISQTKLEILELRRKLREGGQLRAGDALGDGRYLLLQGIGRGGFASVWRARDEQCGRVVALKVLHNSLVGDPARVARFFRGAKVMRAIEHAAVVRVLEEHGSDGGYFYFVMEYVDGIDLRRAVIEKRLRPAQALPVILQIGAALGEAHAKGIVHRDVKPANVLLDETGAPKLTDFDLVAATDTTGGTATGAIGTFIYAAPELMDRPQHADARADVFGLGMTAIFCLSGADLTKDALRRPEHMIESLPCGREVKDVLVRAVQWDAVKRYADARAFSEALFEGLDEVNRPAQVGLREVEMCLPERSRVDGVLASGMRALRAGHLDEAGVMFREALAAVGVDLPNNPRTTMAALLFRLARARLRGLTFVERSECHVAPEALSRVDVCWTACAGLGHVDPLAAYYVQARTLQLALDLGEPHRVARVFAAEASYSAAEGGAARLRASALLDAAREIAVRLEEPYTLGWVAYADGMTAALEGRWQSAYDACECAERILRGSPSLTGLEISSIRWWSLWSSSYLGRVAELSRRVLDGLHAAREASDDYATLCYSTGLGSLVWLAADRPGEARERAREAVARWSHTKFSMEIWWKVLGECQVDLYQGDAKAAYRAAKHVWESLSTSVLGRVQLTKLEALHLRGRCSLMLATRYEGERRRLCNSALQDAQEMEKERMPWASSLAMLLRAGAAALQGDDVRAMAFLRDAGVGLRTAGMALHAAATCYREGKVLGGDEGRVLRTQADLWMSNQGVVDSEKLVGMLVPGFA